MFGIFKNKKNTSVDSEFIFGVADVFRLKDSDDCVVIGNVYGTVNVNCNVNIVNFGDDDAETFKSDIIGLEINKEKVSEASDCLVALRIKEGVSYKVKIGTIIYSGTFGIDSMFRIYSDALKMKMNITGFKYDKLDYFSISDCAEIWRLEQKAISEKSDEKSISDFQDKINALGLAIKEKLLESDEIYCLYNRATGEPYIFSEMILDENYFESEPPAIMVFTKTFLSLAQRKYTTENFEIVKIENRNEKKGIEKFLGEMFWVYGAVCVNVVYEEVKVSASLLIKEEKYKKEYPLSVPVCNPELLRWVTLFNQVKNIETPDGIKVTNIYYSLISKELNNAVFLTPATYDKSEENEEVPELMVQEVSDNRYVVPLFTDINHLRRLFGDDCGVYVNKIDFFASNYDCSINPSDEDAEGCYITKESYMKMKEG